MKIEIGKTYTHKLSGDALTVVKLLDTVAKCTSKNTIVICEKPLLEINTVVCSIENLTL